MTRDRALTALQGTLALIAAYAATLLVAGLEVGQVFDALGFGAGTAGVPRGEPLAHVRLVYGVLGAVLLGWAVLMLAVVRLGLRETDDPRWWWALSVSAGCWCAADTAFSLAVGSWQHALFNLVPALGLGVPLAALRTRPSGSREPNLPRRP